MIISFTLFQCPAQQFLMESLTFSFESPRTARDELEKLTGKLYEITSTSDGSVTGS